MNPILTGRSSGKGQAIVPVAAMLIAGLSLVACTGGGDADRRTVAGGLHRRRRS
ncbi:MAG: hypothetical protein KBF84_11175 [Candidatus Microthrix sp.]|nr:hypothetical protein [Candidatus Microthrix sp.]MBP9835992.1 hypothetical protein [Candidatus Microthrix sp.]